jgi:hypothetical protein
LHLPIPFASQHSADWTSDLPCGSLPSLLGRFRAIQQTLALGVEITEVIGLEPVSQNAKQQVTGQVCGCSSTEHRVPTGPECTDIEVA